MSVENFISHGASFVIGRANSRVVNFHTDKELFTKLYMLGFTIPNIMETMGMGSRLTFERWRKKLGLPKRLRGYHLQHKQVVHVKQQLESTK